VFWAWVDVHRSVVALQAAYDERAEAIDLRAGLQSFPTSNERARQQELLADDYARATARDEAIRTHVIGVLADMNSMRDGSTDHLIDALQESFDYSLGSATPSPERIDHLQAVIDNQGIALFGSRKARPRRSTA
jgi:hypothetical protein